MGSRKVGLVKQTCEGFLDRVPVFDRITDIKATVLIIHLDFSKVCDLAPYDI